ncbi:MAG: GTP-binding protein [Candidatus Helarchaeota archaeon]
MIINFGNKEIIIKIVYWGGAMSGKTTSVEYIFKKFGYDLKSIETSTGRTLFFDFGEILIQKGHWAFHIQIFTSTGQDFYCETRPTVLQGVDGIIFVADSHPSFIHDNLKSWNELCSLIENLGKIPIVICLNKRDLNVRISLNDFKKDFDFNNRKIFETIALNGYNILEAFQEVVKEIFYQKNK